MIQPKTNVINDPSVSGKKVVLMDAFDSFIYVIVQYLGDLGCEPVVLRTHPDNIDTIEEINPDFIVLGPGPGTPQASGHVGIIHHFQDQIPLLGVCLGLQAIGIAYGAKVSPASHLMHGKNSWIEHDSLGVFRYFPHPTSVTRYHSLIIEEHSLPPSLIVTAKSLDDGYIMGVRHKTRPVEGVQFHPESIGTTAGINYLTAFMKTYLH